MKKKQIGGLVVAVVLFIIVGVSSVLVNSYSQRGLEEEMAGLLQGEYMFNPPMDDYIAVVDVVGTIEEEYETSLFQPKQEYMHTTTLEYIDNLMYDSANRGILLYVDSPGGTVYEAEELYLKLKEYKEYTGNPIWTYMAHYAASGGYLVSAASDYIFANPNTTTGSIGVIMSGYDLTGLYEKLGIRYFSITSGEYKDSSQMTEEQMEVYQSQVDEYYDKFVDIVAQGRKMSREDVKTLADGRTYTAKQALENGLIDEIGLYADMQQEMCDKLDVYEFYELSMPENPLTSLFFGLRDMIPKSEAQILKETAADMESGVLMYYAEQLR